MLPIDVRVGFFLALRQIRRASKWTTGLIVFVMTLTLLNLVVVSGILVGLIEGAVVAVKHYYIGDIFISRLTDRPYIDRSQDIIQTAKSLDGVKAISGRYIAGAKIEADYKNPKQRRDDTDNSISTSVMGINPTDENGVSDLSSLIKEGQYLQAGDFDQILLGAMLLRRYLDIESPDFKVLENVQVGDRIRLTINGNIREVTVKGIIKSKVDEIDRRVVMLDSQLRGIIGRADFNVSEAAIRLKPETDPYAVKKELLNAGFDKYAKIQAAEEGEPKFIKDMRKTFDILGSAISSIGLVVAAITIFIVIFINAITRRKYIGILKGVGITGKTIEISYVFQSIFYAVSGSIIGLVIIFGLLVPLFDRHPINFPFSDGILVATFSGTLRRVLLLYATTIIAGYLPARMIVKKNTLDSILGRN
jgi:ABC-type lipoprotein release transport system permease subunit